MGTRSRPWVLVGFLLLLVVGSGLGPADRLTWLLEVAPIVIAAPLLLGTGARFPLTGLLRFWIGAHACVLALGGAYTYAEVPLGYWLQELLGLERNPYDRIGHLAQGFIPGLLAREVLIRCSPVKRGGWLVTFVVAICLAVSALYELVEWWSALLVGEAADAFLGTQGDPWDTQWDMCLALAGATLSLLLLARLHDRQLAALAGHESSP